MNGSKKTYYSIQSFFCGLSKTMINGLVYGRAYIEYLKVLSFLSALLSKNALLIDSDFFTRTLETLISY